MKGAQHRRQAGRRRRVFDLDQRGAAGRRCARRHAANGRVSCCSRPLRLTPLSRGRRRQRDHADPVDPQDDAGRRTEFALHADLRQQANLLDHVPRGNRGLEEPASRPAVDPARAGDRRARDRPVHRPADGGEMRGPVHALVRPQRTGRRLRLRSGADDAGVAAALRERGVPEARIKFELFASAADAASRAPGRAG